MIRSSGNNCARRQISIPQNQSNPLLLATLCCNTRYREVNEEDWNPFEGQTEIDWRTLYKEGVTFPFFDAIKNVPKKGFWPFVRQGDYLCCLVIGTLPLYLV